MRTGTPESSLVLGRNYCVLPSRSGPHLLNGKFFLPPENSSHVDPQPLTPLQRDPRPSEAAQAEEGTPRAKTAKDRGPQQDTWYTPASLGHTHSCVWAQEALQGDPKAVWDICPQAEGGPLVKGTGSPACATMTSFTLARTLMMFCELRLVCYYVDVFVI